MKPLVLGHRGASAYAPENTLAAFQLAFEMGAAGIELDVTLTKDGVPVVIHDDTVERTTNGKGAVKDLTLDEIKQLDASYKFEQYRGEKIPTLAEVLRAVGTRGLINIELKSNTLQTDGLEVAVLGVIEDARATDHVIISSFNPLALMRMYNLNPRLPRGLLYAPNLPVHLRRAWLRPLAHPSAMHPHWSQVTPALARWAQSKNLQINTWTVDDPTQARRLAALGVNAIITNKPDVILQAL